MVRPVAVDFETHPIEDRPAYPPRPVGVAILAPGRRARYLAWDHPTGNNTTQRDARRELRDLWRGSRPLVFHNAPFDLEVALQHLDLSLPPPERVHCTAVLAFLDDSNRRNLSLKPLAAELLGMPPEEAAALRDWIVEHVPEARRAKRKWATWIARAPGDLVAAYAHGDVERTRGLFDLLEPRVRSEMPEAYLRERRLFAELIEAGRAGVPVGERRLRRELRRAETSLEAVDAWLRRRLRAPDLNVDASDDLADALEEADLLDEWVMTAPTKAHPEGVRSTSYDNLALVLKDAKMLSVLGYRSKLSTITKTFLRPWTSNATGGRIFTIWNGVRQASERGRPLVGARTGRLSSTPNFQNAPKRPDVVTTTKREQQRAIRAGLTAWLLPRSIALLLPDVRGLVWAPSGWTLLDRDHDQQELRLLAHYAGGELLRAYHANPGLDFHVYAQRRINAALGTSYARRPIKNTGFGIIYGASIARTAEMIGADEETTRQLRGAYRRELRSFADLERECRRRGRADEPIRTWGGRVCHVETPARVNGRLRTFEYKVLNTLIQGSAADVMKEAWLRYREVQQEGRLVLTVHDEVVVEVPDAAAPDEMRRLREAMESIELDLPLPSTGKCGRRWSTMKEVA